MSNPIYIIPDTNVLMPKNQKETLSKGFINKVKALKEGGLSIHIIVPDLVLKERAFQRLRIAKEALSKLESSRQTIEETTGVTNEPSILNEESLLQGSLSQLNAEVESLGYEILETPYSLIDWEDVVEASVWRKPPYEDKDTEKGFRDKVILETVKFLVKKSPKVDVYFITNDELLCSTVGSLEFENLKVTRNYDPLFNKLKLLKEKNEEEVKRLIEEAPLYFYNQDKQTGLFIQQNLKKKLLDEFAKTLEFPAIDAYYKHKEQNPQFLIQRFTEELPEERYDLENYTRFNGLRIVLGTPNFIEFPSPNRVTWEHKIKIAAYFSGTIKTQYGTRNPSWIQITQVSVIWSADTNEEGEDFYTNGEIETIDFEYSNEIEDCGRNPTIPVQYGFPFMPEITILGAKQENPESLEDLEDKVIQK